MTNEQVNKLVSDNAYMSYLLGLCYGTLGELHSSEEFSMYQKERLMRLFDALNEGCGKIFYGKENEQST